MRVDRIRIDLLLRFRNHGVALARSGIRIRKRADYYGMQWSNWRWLSKELLPELSGAGIWLGLAKWLLPGVLVFEDC